MLPVILHTFSNHCFSSTDWPFPLRTIKIIRCLTFFYFHLNILNSYREDRELVFRFKSRNRVALPLKLPITTVAAAAAESAFAWQTHQQQHQVACVCAFFVCSSQEEATPRAQPMFVREADDWCCRPTTSLLDQNQMGVFVCMCRVN